MMIMMMMKSYWAGQVAACPPFGPCGFQLSLATQFWAHVNCQRTRRPARLPAGNVKDDDDRQQSPASKTMLAH